MEASAMPKAKPASKRAPRRSRPEVAAQTVDKIILLLVSLQSQAAVAAACTDKLGLTADQAEAAIETARGKIRGAIEIDREERAGEAITRLNDIYERSLSGSDNKTALAAQKELNRLLGLAGAAAAKKPALPAAAPAPLSNLKLKIVRPA